MADGMADNEVLGDSLIPVINRLQDIFAQVTLDFKLHLPQVAVVGSQSSGKSSVLEALVGRDFLPRGPDVCTRRPLVLQLVKAPPPPAAGQPAEWGEFLHAPGKVFTDFERVRREIAAETERVAGGGQAISDKPIRLKICSPHVLTMTLIDLPGITKVPVGDQPGNIEARTREIVLSYIRDPSCLILAVSAANADLANSDALQVAALADPDGARTIGVLTKLDIMDRGTSAARALRNGVVPLRLGYCGVVLRAQADIDARRTMTDARAAEEAFIAHHAAGEYRVAAAAHQLGVPALARRLNALLGAHIRALLPGLRRQLGDALDARARELRGYGDALDLSTGGARAAALLQLLCGYAERFAALLDGRCEDMPVSELTGGARIRAIFLDVYGRGLRQLDPLASLSDGDVRTAIRNSGGVAGALLIPQEPFELLARRAISRLLAPSLGVKELVYDELLRIAEAACPAELSRFPALQRRLATAVLEFIQAGAQPAERLIRELVECEHEYINTDHPDFIGGTRAVKAVMEERELRRAGGAGAGAVGIGGVGGASSSSPLAAAAAHNGDHYGDGGGDHHHQHHHHHHHIAKAKSAGALPSGDGRGDGLAGLKGLNDGGGGGGGGNLVDDALLASRYDDASGSGANGGGGGWFSWLTKGGDLQRGSGGGGGGPPSSAASATNTATTQLLLPRQQQQQHTAPASEHEEVQVQVIRLLVTSYFDLVRNTLADLVPKALMKFMVHHSARGMQRHLIASLYSDALAGELLQEREEVTAARTKCAAAVAALSAAVDALDEVPAALGGACCAPGGGGGGGGGGGAGNGTAAAALPAETSLRAPPPLGARDPHASSTHAAAAAIASASAGAVGVRVGSVVRIGERILLE